MNFLDKIKLCLGGNKISNKRDFYSSVSNNRRRVRDGDSNCIGTELYLVGETKEDRYIWDGRNEFFDKLKQSESPDLGYLVTWGDIHRNIAHAAVITSLNPLTVATRNGKGAKFTYKQNIADTNKIYAEEHKLSDIKYFIPSKLQQILEKEALN